MKATFFSSLLIALGLTLCGSAFAQEFGNVKVGDNSLVKVPGVDKDGDGCLSRSEVTPGDQLDKRFSARDANGDGKLCKDEYYAP